MSILTRMRFTNGGEMIFSLSRKKIFHIFGQRGIYTPVLKKEKMVRLLQYIHKIKYIIILYNI